MNLLRQYKLREIGTEIVLIQKKKKEYKLNKKLRPKKI